MTRAEMRVTMRHFERIYYRRYSTLGRRPSFTRKAAEKHGQAFLTL